MILMILMILRRTYAAFLVIAILCLPSAPSLAGPLPDGGVTAKEIAAVMQSKAYPAEVAVDRDGDPNINSSSNGANWAVWFYDCSPAKRCRSIQFYAGWPAGAVTLAQVNDWNNQERFGRVYLENGGLKIEMDVDLAHGATTEAVASDLDRWQGVLSTFVKKFIAR